MCTRTGITTTSTTMMVPAENASDAGAGNESVPSGDLDDNSTAVGDDEPQPGVEPMPMPEPEPEPEPAPIEFDDDNSSAADDNANSSTSSGTWPETRPWPAEGNDHSPDTRPWPSNDGNSTPADFDDNSTELKATSTTIEAGTLPAEFPGDDSSIWPAPLPGDLTDENSTWATSPDDNDTEMTSTTIGADTLPADVVPGNNGTTTTWPVTPLPGDLTDDENSTTWATTTSPEDDGNTEAPTLPDGGNSGDGAAGVGPGVGSWFTEEHFAAFFPNINAPACTGANFFSHEALIQAAAHFPTFANSGNATQDRLELAAFLGQTSHETTGGWSTAPGGPQAWGYCFKEEVGCEEGYCTGYCAAGNPCAELGQGFSCTCVPGETYQGRGPMQLSWNYNYGQASTDLFGNASILMNDPSLVSENATVAYLAGLWFWMTPQPPKPSCHDVMVGSWTPNDSTDAGTGRTPGFGMATNIINGGIECNMATNSKVQDRVDFYRRFAGLLGVAVEESTLYCDQMQSYR